ncbi:hypothetical protein FOCC_FOCC006800 [Frankliniella occidentalis]|uniref:Brachyurin-like n=1 Tax=Frankliniella occidentalis TaxID=133901 RepID=A0A6J1RX33_FRAOC|nr:brachyurin-like [Frankliniella occidentalis]KAE8746434.1 hypothetical protein FOCC_FOCC006800 [Frankliniella occidentalis]
MSILRAAVCVLATALAVAGSPVDPRIVVGPLDPEGLGAASLRISGGRVAKVGQFPYQVALFDSTGSFLGSGAIISTKTVLTAAQCIDGILDDVVVRAGILKLTDMNADGERRTTLANRVIHPNFDAEFFDSDIAIINVPYDFTFPDTKKPAIGLIALPAYSEIGDGLANAAVTVSGWGKTSDSSDLTSTDLQYGQMNLAADHKECAAEYGASIIGTKLCTASSQGASTCAGDVGGPVKRAVDDGFVRTELIGIVSFGRPESCTAGKPVVFTRVSAFYDFIESNSDVKVPDLPVDDDDS